MTVKMITYPDDKIITQDIDMISCKALAGETNRIEIRFQNEFWVKHEIMIDLKTAIKLVESLESSVKHLEKNHYVSYLISVVGDG